MFHDVWQSAAQWLLWNQDVLSGFTRLGLTWTVTLSLVRSWELRSGRSRSGCLPSVWNMNRYLVQCKPCPPCQLTTTICPCFSFYSAPLVKTSQNGSPRWPCMTAMAGQDVWRWWDPLCSGNHPSRLRLVLCCLLTPVPSQLPPPVDRSVVME